MTEGTLDVHPSGATPALSGQASFQGMMLDSILSAPHPILIILSKATPVTVVLYTVTATGFIP